MSSTAAATSTAAASGSAAASSAAASSVAASGSGSSVASSAASTAAASSVASDAATSASSTASAESTSATVVNAVSSAASSSSKKISGGTIGGIVGGVVGGIILIILLIFFLRYRKEKKERPPLPAPKEVVYTPRAMSHRFPTMTSLASGGANINRASSMSTLLAAGSHNGHSRNPSGAYYNSYPIATPSSMSHDVPLPAGSSGSNSSEGSPPLNGLSAPPAQNQASGQRPSLAIDTGLRRDGSGSSEGGHPLPRNKSSVDRLRTEAAGQSRAPSPGTTDRTFSDSGSRPASPHPSIPGMSSAFSRHSFSSTRNGFPRPYSTHSVGSIRPAGGPIGGAPHQRHMQLEMPRRLGAQDEAGDLSPGISRQYDSMHFHNTHDGQMRAPSRPSDNSDFGPPSPRRAQRIPSGLSLSTKAP